MIESRGGLRSNFSPQSQNTRPVLPGSPLSGLTPTEFRLLVELARRPNQVFTRDVLLERVWGYDYLGDSRLVDVAIQRLRAKIESDPSEPELIHTVRGVGYRASR